MVRDFVRPTRHGLTVSLMARHTSAAGRETNAEGLNAQDRWRADGRFGYEEGCYLTRGRTRQDDTPGGRRRERANAIDDDDCADRERDADAQRDDGQIRLGVATGLDRLVPTIEQLRNRRADADGEDCRNRQSS